MTRTGVWLVGAQGNIAMTTMVGAHAIARGETAATGLVSKRAPCADLDLVSVGDLVFAGHEIRTGHLPTVARGLSDRNGVPDGDTVSAVEDALAEIDERVRPGTSLNCGAARDLAERTIPQEGLTTGEIVGRIRQDFAEFRRAHDLDRIVVINVASTEPAIETGRYDTAAAVEGAVEGNDRNLPASLLYAYAAILEGHPYANFTPSTGCSPAGMRELAEQRGVPHAGNDGKTGESLVKAALAPIFAYRNLDVRAWEAHNVLGNTDGKVLESDENKAGKLESKGDILEEILDAPLHNNVRIDYTPSLNDWKTAWDFVHFEGFLDTEMTMQFTWEGSDSALAAPLVLDLVRLLDHADRVGESGVQTQLASFFKAPMDVEEHDLSRQFRRLESYANRHHSRPGEHSPVETGTD